MGKNTNKCVPLYKSAIAVSSKAGLLMDEACANEMAANFVARKGRPVQARGFLEEAARLYEKWGARAKVRQMKQQLSDL